MLLFYFYDTPYIFYNLYKHGPPKPCCVCVNSEQCPCSWKLALQGIHIGAKLHTYWRHKHSRHMRLAVNSRHAVYVKKTTSVKKRSSIYGEKVSP